MQHVLILALACAMLFPVSTVSAEPVLSQYRGVTLGEPLQAVIDRLHIAAADVKTLQETPLLVQRATWQPRPYLSGSTADLESLTEMVLTFYAGRLAEIAVTYDRARTQGLSEADMLEAVAAVYGPPLLLSKATQPSATAPSPRLPIGRWEDADTFLMLWREQYPNRFGLVVTSRASDAALQEAIAEGIRVETAGAPARELARRTAEADVIRARDEKIRLENKAKFKP